MKSRIPLTLAAACLTLAFLAVSSSSNGQQSDAAEAEFTPEEIAEILELNQTFLEDREQRIRKLSQDIERASARVEAGIESMLDMFKKTTDSTNSRHRISHATQDVISMLRKLVDDYREVLETLKTETRERNPSIDRGKLFEDIARLDERINRRVQQIVDLAGSMQGWEDLNRHIGHGRYRTRNPRYNQNRSDARRTAIKQDALLEELSDAMDALERELKVLRETRDNPDITPQFREMLTHEIERKEDIIARRRAQRKELASPNPNRGARRVSRNEAITMERTIAEIAGDVLTDYDRLFQLYDEYLREQEALEIIRGRLKRFGDKQVEKP